MGISWNPEARARALNREVSHLFLFRSVSACSRFVLVISDLEKTKMSQGREKDATASKPALLIGHRV